MDGCVELCSLCCAARWEMSGNGTKVVLVLLIFGTISYIWPFSISTLKIVLALSVFTTVIMFSVGKSGSSSAPFFIFGTVTATTVGGTKRKIPQSLGY